MSRNHLHRGCCVFSLCACPKFSSSVINHNICQQCSHGHVWHHNTQSESVPRSRELPELCSYSATATLPHENEPSEDSEDLVKKKESDYMLDMSCIICHDSFRNIVFMPCCHLVTCYNCSIQSSVSHCIICRKKIESTSNIFI